MFENPRRGRQARIFTTNVPKIVDLQSSSEQIFSENCRWVPLNIGRTGIWKCLNTVFQGQYLPSLSINYVATNKHLEKITTTDVLDKDENLSWSGLQWHRSCHSNVMTPLSIIVATLFLTMKSFSAGAFSSNSRLDVREVKTESVRALSGYFGIKFLSLEIQ